MDATQIVLIVFIVILIIAYPVMMYSRNKKENQRMQEQTNSLKRGDKVLTTSGVYGTVVDLHLEGDKKIVTIETGTDKKKGYISVDAYAIYTIFNEEDEKAAEKAEDGNKEKQEQKADAKVEQKTEEQAKEVSENKDDKDDEKGKKD